ncbi:MAG: iron-containing alcohol dehydrogenase [Propionibacteriaceae bacterium]|jgi:alcohol dehydrogenase class IV|nr:iron-containing alcohol dehydrogenase [Propionibacteriaceae bacterium]
MDFTFATAGRLIFGPGKVRELAGIVASLGSRPLIVTGSNPARVTPYLEGISDYKTFPVSGEPTMDVVRAGAELARQHEADVVVGFGGGSAMDSAKIIASLATNGGDPLDYAEVIGKGQPLSVPSLPVVAVPTTSGTGSEVTANGVVSSGTGEDGVKVSLRSPSMLAKVALVDPELTLDVPPSVTAHSGLDALVQCIEPYVSWAHNPITDALTREGMLRSARSLRSAYEDGSNLDARTDLSITSLFSGISLANAKLGAAHGIAAPAGGMLGAPHGAITASVMPAVMRVNLAAARAGRAQDDTERRYTEVGLYLTGKADAEAGIEWFAATARALGVEGLGALGLTEELVPKLAVAAARASSSKGNPAKLDQAEFEEILRESL